MKVFSSLLLTVALTVGLATPARADAADAEKFVSWIEKLADTVTADQNDCPKMAADINKSVDDNKAMLDAAALAHKNGQQLSGDQAKRMAAAGQKLAQAVVAKCAQDAGVKASIGRLPGRPQK
jgi:ABC-type sugar transport system ATPase subunit